MRKTLCGITGVAAAGFLAVASISPAAAQRSGENELLGIRLWRTWRDVLNRHGQPTRIEMGAVTTPMPGQQGDTGVAAGGGLPGLAGMGPTGGPMRGPMSMGPMGGMGGPPAGYGSMIQQMQQRMGSGSPYGGPPGGSGSPYGGPPGGSGSPYGGPAGGGGNSKMAAMASGMSGGTPAPSTGPMMGPMTPGGGAPGLAGFGAAPGGAPFGPGGMMGAGQTVASGEGEVTWIYEKGPLTYMFLFNKDGRVIQISQFGYRGGGATSRGIKLGDPVSKVYRAYGWADSSTKAGNQLTLDYSHKAKAAFQLLNRGKGAQVVGITVALTERSQIPAG